MKIGNLVKHTATGNIAVIMKLQHETNAFLYFITGRQGYQAWYSTRFLEAI